jgi:hypothetical protein
VGGLIRLRLPGDTGINMNAKRQKMSRTQFLWLRWLTKRCPWYIRLIAGKQADEIFRRVKDAEADYCER